MKKILFLLPFFYGRIQAQELFVYTDPASNVPAKSIGFRLTNYLMDDLHASGINYHLMPEIMVGINRKWMARANAFLSNRESGFGAEGGQLYLKYRFLSQDDIHNHFRMAAFLRGSFNNTSIHQPAIDFNGHSSGYESGLIATKLVKKVAVSGTVSFLHARNNGREKFLYGEKNRNAVGYSLALGKLMLPREYSDYRQVNLNLMLELLGQTTLGNGNGFVDVAPSVQLIFNSRARIDLAFRYNLTETLHRTAPNGFLVRFEYNFFNAFK